MTEKAICVQVFNKPDTAVQTLDAMTRCDGAEDFDLLVVQDGLEGNRWRSKYENEHAETRAAMTAWIERKAQAFRSVRFMPQTQGRGTAGTARVTIDAGLQDHDWVVFSEDDVIFEPDALTWFRTMIEHPGFLRDDVWAIAGESKYFDAKGQHAPPEVAAEARDIARSQDLISRYTYLRLVPSSCFATTRAKWAEFAETRGMPRGPRFVADRCKDENKLGVWPVIARCRDIGMHHRHGYSMTVRKLPENIPQKNTYLASSDLPPMTGAPEFYSDTQKLFRRFTSRFAQPGTQA